MKEVVGLHSSFEDIYGNREQFPDVYSRVMKLAEYPDNQASGEQLIATPRIESIKSPLDQIRESWQREAHTRELVTRVSRRFLN